MHNYANHTAAQKQRQPRRLNEVRGGGETCCAYDLRVDFGYVSVTAAKCIWILKEALGDLDLFYK